MRNNAGNFTVFCADCKATYDQRCEIDRCGFCGSDFYRCGFCGSDFVAVKQLPELPAGGTDTGFFRHALEAYYLRNPEDSRLFHEMGYEVQRQILREAQELKCTATNAEITCQP